MRFGTWLRTLAVIACTISVAACAPNRLPLTAVVEVEQANGQIGGDVYADRRASGEVVPSQRGSQIFEVRTVIEVVNSENKSTSESEIEGADCLLEGDGFSAKVVTPTGVRVPLYGYRTGELTLECSKDGYGPAIAIAETYNKTFAERQSGATSGGLLGVLIVSLINAASDETDDEFEYADEPVRLEKLEEISALD